VEKGVRQEVPEVHGQERIPIALLFARAPVADILVRLAGDKG